MNRFMRSCYFLIPVAMLGGVPTKAVEEKLTRISIAADGTQANGHSIMRVGHTMGRCVTFYSEASNLVAGDTNECADVFVYDLWSRRLSRVSIASNGGQADGGSYDPTVSSDGRFVAFWSDATNLVENDTNGCGDAFVHDRWSGQTSRVSVASDGSEGNGISREPGVSDDGRFLAFYSEASNLVDDDANECSDIFVHDRTTGLTTRVSVSSEGEEGNNYCWHRSSLSMDGRYVGFASSADNLVPEDANRQMDAFVHDRLTRSTTRVSVASDGKEGNAGAGNCAITPDGRMAVFSSGSTNLYLGDNNRAHDVFRHELASGVTEVLSLPGGGPRSNGHSYSPSASRDGSIVAYFSLASNLVPGDNNDKYDVFVQDRSTRVTVRVSVAADGQEGNGASAYPCMSADGRWVAFFSSADNLVPGDTNGVADIFLSRIADSACNGRERILTNCLAGDNHVMKARVVRADPGTEVLFKLDSDRQRTRIVSNGGKAKAKWSGVEDGMREVTAELGCGDALWTEAACGEVLCTGHERIDVACNQQGVVRATVADGSPDQPVTFLLDGERPRLRTFNGKGKAKAKWGTSGGVPSGPHEIAVELACGDELPLAFDCP